MDTLITSGGAIRTGERRAISRLAALPFDWITVCLCLIFVCGLFLDGWAHNHGYVDDSFFTLWHAFFYAGFGLIALFLAGTVVANRVRGLPWAAALPAGYSLSLLGVLIFAAGGVGDMVWHELFGVEADFEALLSPSHLVLGLGMALIVSGPLRAAWLRADVAESRPGWRQLGPALASLTILLSVLTFLGMGAHPLATNIAGAQHREYMAEIGQIAGVYGIVVTGALLLGPLLLVMRRWTLPWGSLSLVWGVNTVVMAIVNWHHDHTLYLLGAMVVAVVVIDVVYQSRVAGRPLDNVRWFAALAPFLLFGAYFVALLATEGTNWPVHLWAGIVVEAALTGWLLSYLVAPPAKPPVLPAPGTHE